jgi:Na+-translocating ferredoxin:NAD+ oxidoreductase RnfE subunit
VQILGLCPILAISTNIVNAVSLGLATILVMAMSNLVIAALRNFIPYEIRIPVFILIIAAWSRWSDSWPSTPYLTSSTWCSASSSLIVTILHRAGPRVEAFAAKNEPGGSTVVRHRNGHRPHPGAGRARRQRVVGSGTCCRASTCLISASHRAVVGDNPAS